MECHEGATMIKTFRGRMQENQIDVIALHTNDGSTGYRLKKLSGMPAKTESGANEAVIKIFSVPPSTPASTDLVDFSDNELLGVFYFLRDQGTVAITSETIIFDNMIFNQDIYVTFTDAQTNNDGFNYYIELEQRKLDMGESTVATLKDIRNLEYPPPGG
jgi:hypothetical protein